MLARPSVLARLAVLVAVTTVGACYPKTVATPGSLSANAVTQASTTWPGVTEAQLTTGRDAFMAKCNMCHGYPDVRSVEEAKWPSVVQSMGKKAHLTAPEKDEVLHYILALRSDQGGR